MKLYAALMSTLLFTTCLSFAENIPVPSTEEIKEIQKKYQETVKAAVDHYCSEPVSKDPVLQDQKMCAQLKEISELKDIAIKGEIINKYNEYKTTGYVSTIKPTIPANASNKAILEYVENIKSKDHQQEIQLLKDISRNACQNECIETSICDQYYIEAYQAYQQSLPKDWIGSIKEFFRPSQHIAEKKKAKLVAWQKYYNARKQASQCILITAIQFLAMTNYHSKNPASTGIGLLSLTQPRGKLTGFRLK